MEKQELVLLYSAADADLMAIANEYRKNLLGEWMIIHISLTDVSEESFFHPRFWHPDFKNRPGPRIFKNLLDRYLQNWINTLNSVLWRRYNGNIIICANSIIIESIYSIQTNSSINSYILLELRKRTEQKFKFRVTINRPEGTAYPQRIFKTSEGFLLLMPLILKNIARDRTLAIRYLFSRGL